MYGLPFCDDAIRARVSPYKNRELAEEFAARRYRSVANATFKWTMIMRNPANDRHRSDNNFRGAITGVAGRVCV